MTGRSENRRPQRTCHGACLHWGSCTRYLVMRQGPRAAECRLIPGRRTPPSQDHWVIWANGWTGEESNGGGWGRVGGNQRKWDQSPGRVTGCGQGSTPRPPRASHPARLHTVGQHDQGPAPLLPHQAPEVTHRLGQGALGCNELVGVPETLVEETRQVTTPLLLLSSAVLHALRAPNHGLTGMKLALI